MVKLQYDSNGQFKITLPKQLLVAMGWEKGDSIRIAIDGTDRLLISREKQGTQGQRNQGLKDSSRSKERLRQR